MMLSLYLSIIPDTEQKNKFTRLYTDYCDVMRWAAMRILKDPYLAEDAVHYAFIRISRIIEKIQEEPCHKTRTFMVVVVENIAKDMWKKRKKDTMMDFDSLEIPAEGNLLDDLLSKIQVETVAEKIELLPDGYREVLVLRYLQDYTDVQIAALVGISHAAVRKRLERARQKLCVLLKEEEL